MIEMPRNVASTPDSDKGRKWADRALERIRREAEAIGVSLNTDKTRVVSMTEPRAVFAFLGFEFRWIPSAKTGRWYAHLTPRTKKVTGLLQSVRDTLRASRHLPTQVAVAKANAIIRGWVNYFRVGNSSQAFGKVRASAAGGPAHDPSREHVEQHCQAQPARAAFAAPRG
jgi:hypothetical protein